MFSAAAAGGTKERGDIPILAIHLVHAVFDWWLIKGDYKMNGPAWQIKSSRTFLAGWLTLSRWLAGRLVVRPSVGFDASVCVLSSARSSFLAKGIYRAARLASIWCGALAHKEQLVTAFYQQLSLAHWIKMHFLLLCAAAAAAGPYSMCAHAFMRETSSLQLVN